MGWDALGELRGVKDKKRAAGCSSDGCVVDGLLSLGNDVSFEVNSGGEGLHSDWGTGDGSYGWWRTWASEDDWRNPSSKR